MLLVQLFRRAGECRGRSAQVIATEAGEPRPFPQIFEVGGKTQADFSWAFKADGNQSRLNPSPTFPRRGSWSCMLGWNLMFFRACDRGENHHGCCHGESRFSALLHLIPPLLMRCECGTGQEKQLEADGEGCAEPQTLLKDQSWSLSSFTLCS